MIEAARYIPQQEQNFFVSDTYRSEPIPLKSESYLYKRADGKEVKKPTRKIVQYEIDFDIDRYKKADTYSGQEQENYLEEQDTFTTVQILTALGERYNRSISKITYELKDGVLYGKTMNIPFIDVIKNGRDYRKQNGSSLHDQAREQAEFDSFVKLQTAIKKGRIVGLYSPPSPTDVDSIYHHEFIDFFRQIDDTTVELWRCSANTGIESFKKMTEELTGEKIEEVGDIDIKKRVFVYDDARTGISSINALHQYFHKDHEVMSDEDFEKIKNAKALQLAISEYKREIRRQPPNKRNLKILLNSMLNISDGIADALKKETFVPDHFELMTKDAVYEVGLHRPQSVDTDCGDSGGYDIASPTSGVSALGAYGVSSFASSGEYSGENADKDPRLCKCSGLRPHFHCTGQKKIEGNEGEEEKVECKNPIIVKTNTTFCLECKEGRVC